LGFLVDELFADMRVNTPFGQFLSVGLKPVCAFTLVFLESPFAAFLSWATHKPRPSLPSDDVCPFFCAGDVSVPQAFKYG